MRQEIRRRLDEGESLESIALKVKENGMDVFKILQEDQQAQENTFEYILSQKGQGVAKERVDEKLQTSFLLTEEEVDIVNQKLRTKGRANLVIGYSIGIILIILSLLTGRLSISAMLMIGVSFWRIAVGHDILSKLKS